MTARRLLAIACAITTLTPVCATAGARVQDPEIVAEVRIHGNYGTPDADVLALAGVRVGDALESGGVEAIADRLRRSGRFESVDIRKRFRSLTESRQVALIIIVQEHPGVEKGGVMPGPVKRFGNSIMALPTLEYVDGYGVTGGGRISFVNIFGAEGHLVVPLTVGSTRQAAAEIDKTFRAGPVRRLHGGGSIASRENPGYDVRDLRQEIWVEGVRPFARVLSVGARAGWTDVSFGDVQDRFTSYGASVTLDTRVNPAFPRNAVYVDASWRAWNPQTGSSVNRYRVDARGYAGFIGSSVISVRAVTDTADGALPTYERALVGGFSTLRGFRAGSFVGDSMAAASAEWRIPMNSPLRIGQTGIAIFYDAGTAYDHGTRLADATFHYGVGAGWYLRAPLVQFDLDVGYGLDHGTRVHVMAGLRF
ncbi:MAG: BamA/TamA family outer membrane protein [Acidobacteria bacterium]|nr:BamA/TamA family outer membrane protein [Acidobacteriota bacterium]